MPKNGGAILDTLYENLKLLCDQRGIKPGKMCVAKAGKQAVVDCIEAVAQSAVDDIHLSLYVGKVAGQNIAVHHAGAVAVASAPAVVAPAAEHEQEQDNDPPGTVPAEAKSAAVVGGAPTGAGFRRPYFFFIFSNSCFTLPGL